MPTREDVRRLADMSDQLVNSLRNSYPEYEFTGNGVGTREANGKQILGLIIQVGLSNFDLENLPLEYQGQRVFYERLNHTDAINEGRAA